MWGDMSLWNVQGPLLHSGDHNDPRLLTVVYNFNLAGYYAVANVQAAKLNNNTRVLFFKRLFLSHYKSIPLEDVD